MTSHTIDYLTDRAPGQGSRTAPRARLDSDAPTLSLDGLWKFRLLPMAPGTPAAAGMLPSGESDEAVADVAYDDTEWERLHVPAHWVLQGDGRYGRPSYTNMALPFPIDAPNVPAENPTGDYRRTFDLPADFAASLIVLLRFDGVESRYKVWLNGIEIGVGSGGRLAQEFDVTSALQPGANLIVVRVHQWSASTYLEDQDQWWLPGIFRDVTLLARPAGSFGDVWLRTEFDSVSQRGTIVPALRIDDSGYPVTLTVPEFGVSVRWAAARDVGPIAIEAVEPWSAEIPRLYDAQLTSSGESVSLRVGFRSIEIRGDVFLVNGQRVVFHGMNRHETHPVRGRVFDEADARANLELMKQHNVNAIRTSHYPPHPRLLDLADELGFWVILECDLETHAFGQYDWIGNPSDDVSWREAYLDRIERTVERDKNHPSIVIWSLGNESGTGSNLAAMSAWVHQRDPSRPVHYEGDYTGDYTDVYSRMYPPLDLTAWIGGEGTPVPLQDCDEAQSERQRSKPYFHCEYAHAMGNGPGSLDSYEDLVDRLPRLHGGFVWEWRDHGILTTAPDGTPYYAYGGDFGEVIHDGNFVMDGMVRSDDTPSPALAEFKSAVAPIRVHLEREGSSGAPVLRIRNTQHSAGTSGHCFILRVQHDGVPAGSADLDVPDLGPGETATIGLPDVSIAGDAETWITVDVVLAADTAWAARGHIVSSTQLDLTPAQVGLDMLSHARHAVGDRTASNGAEPAQTLTLGVATLRAGRVVELRGAPATGVDLALWRAPIDNDRVNLQAWKEAGLDRLQTRIVSVEAASGSLCVISRHAPGNSPLSFETKTVYTELDNAAVRVRVDILPSAGWGIVLPRIGVRLALPTDVDAVSWFGTGPAESYPDSRQAAQVGLFSSGIDELNVDYARPQESGHRSHLRYLDLSASGAPWLRITAQPDERGRRPGFTLSRHSAEELTAAAHTYQLPRSSASYLYLDAAQHGLGSAACGPDVESKYALRAQARSVTFVISGLPASP